MTTSGQPQRITTQPASVSSRSRCSSRGPAAVVSWNAAPSVSTISRARGQWKSTSKVSAPASIDSLTRGRSGRSIDAELQETGLELAPDAQEVGVEGRQRVTEPSNAPAAGVATDEHAQRA